MKLVLMDIYLITLFFKIILEVKSICFIVNQFVVIFLKPGVSFSNPHKNQDTVFCN